MLENIPLEMRLLPQWVAVDMTPDPETGKPKKHPLHPRTGSLASVIDPNTWGTFEEAARTGLPVGFVLTDWDPYTIIDLDNKPEKPCTEQQWNLHQKILTAFNAYTERSISGTGYHIIIRGRVPSGARRDNVEVYSSSRYMICTGDVVRNTPITDYQPLLDQLYAEMEPVNRAELVQVDGYLTDVELLEMGSRAVNGDKFDALCGGQWQELGYSSQSEADFALLSMLAYYSRDNEQVRRVFRLTALGQRDKAQRNDKYLDFALSKIRANEPPPVDIEALSAKAPAPKATAEVASPVLPGVELPPGLVGEVAQYIYQTAVRPVPEIALAGALAVVAGVCARSYNVSGTGLNQYLILLARTGAGKEGAVTGIDNLIAAVRAQVPMADQFIGPSAFASGPALVKTLDDRPCFVSVLGEFGLTLQQLCDPRANSAEKTLKKVLLDLYAKSGWNKVLRSSVYSDKEKNTKVIQAPNVTILGESTPETFFEGLGSVHIAEGLIPRFSVIEYTGPRPPRNRNAGVPPSHDLVTRFGELIAISLSTSNNNTCAMVQIAQDALYLLDEFDTLCDAKINEAKVDVEMQLWNRAHLKALKLAALVAVGVSPHAPVITADLAGWAIRFTTKDIAILQQRFQEGDIGSGEVKQENDLRKVIEEYLHKPYKQVASYGVAPDVHRDKVIPYDYIRRRGRMISAIANDKRGATRALKEALADMVAGGALVQLTPQQVMERYKKRGDMYMVGDSW